MTVGVFTWTEKPSLKLYHLHVSHFIHLLEEPQLGKGYSSRKSSATQSC